MFRGLCHVAVVLLCLLAGMPGGLRAEERDGGLPGSLVSTVGRTALFLGRGVTGSRYRAPGWREYLVTDRVTLPEIHLPARIENRRLFSDADLLRARTALSRTPHSRWHQSLLDGVSIPPSRQKLVKHHADYAKACAFLYRLNRDESMLDRALTALRTVPEPPEIIDMEGGDPDSGWGEYLDSAEAVISLCAAYDLLRDDLPGDLASLMERRTLEVTWQLVEGLRVTPRNNHATVMTVAICTSALVFEDTGRYCADSRDGLFQRGMDVLSQSLALIAPDGGYAEGPYYGRYILNHLAPFAVYLEAVTGTDLFDAPRLERFVNWVLDNHKGGGHYTAFDDSYDTSFLFLPLIAGQSSSNREWDRFIGETAENERFSANLVEALVTYRPRMTASRPRVSYPARFYPDTGQCVFRDSWPEPNLFISLVNERMRYRADVHEHFDPLVMELSAGGEEIVIDGGYGGGTGDSDRSWFLSSKSNSTVLVDGFGADPNPHNNDRFDGGLDFAFSSPSFGAAGARQTVGDAELRRRMFFSTDGFSIMIDDMEGRSAHNYAVQYLTPCKFLDRGNGHISFQGRSVSMNALMMPGVSDGWRVERLPGLKTNSGSTESTSLIRFVSDRVEKASLVSIWTADGADGAHVTIMPAPADDVEWRRLQSHKTGRITDLLRLRGEKCETSVVSGLGTVLMSSYTDPAAPDVIFGADVTSFSQGNHALSFSRPALFYLERHDVRWSGYIDFEPRDEPFVLTLSSIDARPVVVDGAVVSVTDDGDSAILYLERPGRISFGGAPVHIDVPLCNTVARDSLRVASDNRFVSVPGHMTSDYDRALFRNQAGAAMFGGMNDVARQLGDTYFNDPDLLRKAADTVQGLMQSTYHGSRRNNTFILPHRYGFDYESEAWRLDVREEGEWHTLEPRARDLRVTGAHDDGSRVSYRRERPFGDERRHSVEAVWRDDSGFGSSLRNGGGTESSDWYLYHRRDNGDMLRPEVYVNEGELSAMRLHSRFHGVYASLSGDGVDGDAVYSQNISGTVGGFGWRADGVQDEADDYGRYRAGINGTVGGGHWLSAAAGLREQDGVRRIDDASLDLGGTVGRVYHSGTYERRDGDFYMRSGAGFQSGLGMLYAGLRLRHGFNGKATEATVRHSRGFDGGVYTWSEALYGYDDAAHRDVVRLRQRLRFPVADDLAMSLIMHERLGGILAQEAFGGGVTVPAPVSVYAEVLRYRLPRPVSYSSTVGLLIPWGDESTLDCSAYVQWSGHRADMAELRVDGPFSGGRRTGVFYRYVRPREKRLEVFVVWSI